MKRSDITVMPNYHKPYASLVEDKELLEVLPTGGIDVYENAIEQLNELGNQAYAEGKWSVKQIIEHITDCERIFTNRALRYVRNDKTELPGFEENDYAAAARSNERSVEDLLQELKDQRKSTFNFFKNLSDEELLRTGFGNGQEISVAAIGFISVGHPLHHFNVIKERYFPLLREHAS